MKQVSTTNSSFITTHHEQLVCEKNLFYRYCLVFLLGAILLFAGGCKKDHELTKKTVPFKAQFVTNSVTIQPGNPIQKDHVAGTGDGTPIGSKTNFDAIVQFDITGASPLLITGITTFTTENGDKIFSTSNGYSPDPDAKGDFFIIGSNEITGGTGKYAGATGSLTFLTTGNLNSPAGAVSFQGSITY